MSTVDLFMRGEHLGDDMPQVYIALPLSQIADARERGHLELLEDTVCQAVRQATVDSADPWEVRVHSPLKHTSPWRRDTRGRHRLGCITLGGPRSAAVDPWLASVAPSMASERRPMATRFDRRSTGQHPQQGHQRQSDRRAS